MTRRSPESSLSSVGDPLGMAQNHAPNFMIPICANVVEDVFALHCQCEVRRLILGPAFIFGQAHPFTNDLALRVSSEHSIPPFQMLLRRPQRLDVQKPPRRPNLERMPAAFVPDGRRVAGPSKCRDLFFESGLRPKQKMLNIGFCANLMQRTLAGRFFPTCTCRTVLAAAAPA